jgi:hypothetical protein
MTIFYFVCAFVAAAQAIYLAKETDNRMWYFLILIALYMVGAVFCN